MDYKVFMINECDWVVAVDEKQAIICWESTVGIDFDEDENTIELETKELSKINFFYDTDAIKKTTFKKRIEEVLKSGEETVPFFLASSEF